MGALRREKKKIKKPNLKLLRHSVRVHTKKKERKKRIVFKVKVANFSFTINSVISEFIIGGWAQRERLNGLEFFLSTYG